MKHAVTCGQAWAQNKHKLQTELDRGDFARQTGVRSSLMEPTALKSEGKSTAAVVRTVARKLFHAEITHFFVVTTKAIKVVVLTVAVAVVAVDAGNRFIQKLYYI